MTSQDDRSAPEVVESLRGLWAGLALEQQVVLGCKWVDHSVRSLLPLTFERHSQDGVGAVLRTLPEISSLDALRFAHDQLESLKTPDRPVEPLAAYFSVLASLGTLVRGFTLGGCCFLAVMAGRFAFGDDRVVQTMIADLTASGAPKAGE